MSLPTTPSSLAALFLFNPTLGEEATEARKILFFCDNRHETVHRRTQPGQSNYVDLNYQKDLCGIAEGLIAFTREFSPEHLCESVHCSQHRYAFLEAETNYWIVLVVKNPTVIIKDTSGKKDATTSVQTEYLEEELEDSVLQAIIHRCYSLFTLFNSKFHTIVEESSYDALRMKLNLFMGYFLPTIRFSQLIYFTDIHGFQFLPVEKITFLTIQYIMNLLTLNFTTPNGSPSQVAGANGLHALTGTTGLIKNCALMYNSKLIYSGLNSEIMFLLYSLDQDMMYWFLVEYLTLKENLHLDICRYYSILKDQPKFEPLNKWSQPPPTILPGGIFNVPESIYERNGRCAENKKAFEKALNKGEIPPETEFHDEEEAVSAEDGNTLDEDGILLEKPTSSRSTSGSSTTSTLPYGFMVGPYRAHASAPSVAGSHSAATMPGFAPSNGGSGSPINPSNTTCINSPLIYLDGIHPKHVTGTDGSGVGGEFGSGNPKVEGNLPVYGVFPGSSSATPATDASEPTSAGASKTSRPLRLVVYQKYKITLFLIVEEEPPPSSTSSSSSSQSLDSSLESTYGRLNLSPSTLSYLSSLQISHPSLTFYSQLETFMDTQLKKLAEMLLEQTTKLNLIGGVGGGGGTGGGGGGEEPWRFLYFNHMNLALKTSLSSTPSNAAKGGAAGGQPSSSGNLLTMETIKIIRELHHDFNTPSFRSQTIATTSSVGGISSATTNVKSSHTIHSIREEGCTEVCVKTRNHGWVIGRRATQSHREFFLLLEEKFSNLTEVQEEVESLSRTYFYNIFIH